MGVITLHVPLHRILAVEFSAARGHLAIHAAVFIDLVLAPVGLDREPSAPAQVAAHVFRRRGLSLGGFLGADRSTARGATLGAGAVPSGPVDFRCGGAEPARGRWRRRRRGKGQVWLAGG